MTQRSASKLNASLVIGYGFTALSPALVYFGKEGNTDAVVVAGFVVAALSVYFVNRGREVASRKQNQELKEDIKAVSKQNEELKEDIKTVSVKQAEEFKNFRISYEARLNHTAESLPPGAARNTVSELKRQFEEEFTAYEQHEGDFRLEVREEEIAEEQAALQWSKQWKPFYDIVRSTLIGYLDVVRTKKPAAMVTYDFPELPLDLRRTRWGGSICFANKTEWQVYIPPRLAGGDPTLILYNQADDDKSLYISIRGEKLEVSNNNLLPLPGILAEYKAADYREILPKILKKAIDVQLTKLPST